MRCFTLQGGASYVKHGLRVKPTPAGYGVVFYRTVIRVDTRIDDHLARCTAALTQRRGGDLTPNVLLGEDGLITPALAREALEEVERDGWFVDHLAVDTETYTLGHIPYDSREARCLLLVPASPRGVVYSSNIPCGGQQYLPLEETEGIEPIFCDAYGAALIRLRRHAELRVLRANTETLVKWDGRSLRKRLVGRRAA